MKNWFLLGTGFFFGVVVGVVFTAYILMDDMSASASAGRRPQSIPAKPVVSVSRKAVTAPLPQAPSVLSAVSQSQSAERPVAIQAQAVEVGASSSESETTVVATAPTERANVESAP